MISNLRHQNSDPSHRKIRGQQKAKLGERKKKETFVYLYLTPHYFNLNFTHHFTSPVFVFIHTSLHFTSVHLFLYSHITTLHFKPFFFASHFTPPHFTLRWTALERKKIDSHYGLSQKSYIKTKEKKEIHTFNI